MINLLLRPKLGYIIIGYILFVLVAVPAYSKFLQLDHRMKDNLLGTVCILGMYMLITKYVKLYKDTGGDPSYENIKQMLIDFSLILLLLIVVPLFMSVKGNDWQHYIGGRHTATYVGYGKGSIAEYSIVIGLLSAMVGLYKGIMYLA